MSCTPGLFCGSERKIKNQRGQAFLIVVLVMVIALTVGLSVAARSVVTVRTATDEVNSQKAFSAAEAGIEQVLQSGNQLNFNNQLSSQVSIKDVSVLSVGNTNQLLLNNGNPVPQDDGVDVWLTSYNQDPSKLYNSPYWNGNLTVYWGDPSSSCNNVAALEIVVISGTRASPILSRYAVDPCRSSTNNFSAATSNVVTAISGQKFHYSYVIPTAISSGLIARVTPLYTASPIAVSGSVNFPAQGQLISATGVAGSTNRKVMYYSAYESVPSEFFYSSFSY